MKNLFSSLLFFWIGGSLPFFNKPLPSDVGGALCTRKREEVAENETGVLGKDVCRRLSISALPGSQWQLDKLDEGASNARVSSCQWQVKRSERARAPPAHCNLGCHYFAIHGCVSMAIRGEAKKMRGGKTGQEIIIYFPYVVQNNLRYLEPVVVKWIREVGICLFPRETCALCASSSARERKWTTSSSWSPSSRRRISKRARSQ